MNRTALACALCLVWHCQLVAAEVNYSVQTDVVYGHKDGMALTYDVFTPDKARGVGLMLMVSGGWVSRWSPPDQTVNFIRPVLEQGFTVFAVRHGSSPRYIIPEIAEDVKKALIQIHQHASDYHVAQDRLGVFGFSAGGHLSLLLGTQTNDRGTDGVAPRIRAVVAVFPPTDLAPYVEPGNPLREQFPALKFDPEQSDRYSPLKHVSGDDAPTLLVHGDKDELVPIWHSQKIAAAFAEDNVAHDLITIEGAAHGFDADGNRQMMAGLLGWFQKHLVDGKTESGE